MSNHSKVWTPVNWLLGTVLLITGALNIWLVAILPGLFYLLLSFLYFPPIEPLTRQKLGFAFPHWLKLVIWLLVMWGTLAVGDLAEILGL